MRENSKPRSNVYFWGYWPKQKWWVQPVPLKVAGPAAKFKAIGCGDLVFSGAVGNDGALYTVGINDLKQLGHNDDSYRYNFSHVLSLWDEMRIVKKVACGGQHMLVLTERLDVWSCGRYFAGQLGRTTEEETKDA